MITIWGISNPPISHVFPSVSCLNGMVLAYLLMVILRVPAADASTSGLTVEGHGTQQSKAMGNRASCY